MPLLPATPWMSGLIEETGRGRDVLTLCLELEARACFCSYYAHVTDVYRSEGWGGGKREEI